MAPDESVTYFSPVRVELVVDSESYSVLGTSASQPRLIRWRCPATETLRYPVQWSITWLRLGHGIHGNQELESDWSNTESAFVFSFNITKMERLQVRYACLLHPRGRAGQAFSQLQLYQLVGLRDLWVDVGEAPLHFRLAEGQRAILQCRRGQLEPHPIDDGGCRHRRVIKGSSGDRHAVNHSCSNGGPLTNQGPTQPSGAICGLSLKGCSVPNTMPTKDCRQRCIYPSLVAPSVPLTLLNDSATTVLFYFNSSSRLCLPFHAHKSSSSLSSVMGFPSLRLCEDSCIVVLGSELQRCLQPPNKDQEEEDKVDQIPEPISVPLSSRRCGRGHSIYEATFDLNSNECRWFYRVQTHKCSSSTQHSSNDSKQQRTSENRFPSMKECSSQCKKNRDIIMAEGIKLCGHTQTGWLYDPRKNECKKAVVNHTRVMNQMSIEEKHLCYQMCQFPSRSEVCASIPQWGICHLPMRLRWHFNIRLQTCLPFLDGNCGSSFNRFHSLLACQLVCLTSTNTSTSLTTTPEELLYSPATVIIKPLTLITPPHHPTVSSDPGSSSTSLLIHPSTRVFYADPCFGQSRQLLHPDINQSVIVSRWSFDFTHSRCIKVNISLTIPVTMGYSTVFDTHIECTSACTRRLHTSLKSRRCVLTHVEDVIFEMLRPPSLFKLVSRFIYVAGLGGRSGGCVRVTIPSLSSADLHRTEAECEAFCSPAPATELLIQDRCRGSVVLADEEACHDILGSRYKLFFYHAASQQCLQYSSCRPTLYLGNVFSLKQQCETTCLPRVIEDVCKQPLDRGHGPTAVIRYYYDFLRARCLPFTYGGGLGSRNRFRTARECQRVCSQIWGPPKGYTDKQYQHQERADVRSQSGGDQMFHTPKTKITRLRTSQGPEYCYESRVYGNCLRTHSNLDNQYGYASPRISLRRYFYDPVRQICEEFRFAGCGMAGRNSFMTVHECDRACVRRMSMAGSSFCRPPSTTIIDNSMCSAPRQFWHYDFSTGNCLPHLLCLHDDQMTNSLMTRALPTRKLCLEFCRPPKPRFMDFFDICSLPPAELPQPTEEQCSKPAQRWIFSGGATGRCKLQMNNSCSVPEYGNVFPSQLLCKAACTPAHILDVCKLPADSGPCHHGNLTKYFYFDWERQECQHLFYGGCLGNRNRFSNIVDCRTSCQVHSRCNVLQQKRHNCRGRPHRVLAKTTVHYDASDNQCKMLTEPVCLHEDDFFSSMEQCNRECLLSPDFTSITFAASRVSERKKCLFSRQYHTFPLCGTSHWLPRYFYDAETSTCQFFYYNGCDGGTADRGNRFISLDDCLQSCVTQMEPTTSSGASSSSDSSSEDITSSTQQPSVKQSPMCPPVAVLCIDLPVVGGPSNCSSNGDCPSTSQCCRCSMETAHLTSPAICVALLHCSLTEHGCCADGASVATDSNHSLCPRSRSYMVSMTPKVVAEATWRTYVKCRVTGDPRPRSIIWTHIRSGRGVEMRDLTLDRLDGGWLSALPLDDVDWSAVGGGGFWSCAVRGRAPRRRRHTTADSDDQEFKESPQLGAMVLLVPTRPRNESSNEQIVVARLGEPLELRCYSDYLVPQWHHNGTAVVWTNDGVIALERMLLIRRSQYRHAGWWSCGYGTGTSVVLISRTSDWPIAAKITVAVRGTAQLYSGGSKCRWYALESHNNSSHSLWGTDISVNQHLLTVTVVPGNTIAAHMCVSPVADVLVFFLATQHSLQMTSEPAGTVMKGQRVTLLCGSSPHTPDQSHVWWRHNGTAVTRNLIKDPTSTRRLIAMVTISRDSGWHQCGWGTVTMEMHFIVIASSVPSP